MEALAVNYGGLLFWAGLILMAASTFFVFRDLADFSQLIPGRTIQRKAVMRTWYLRHYWAALFVISVAAILWLNLQYNIGPAVLMWLSIPACAVLFYLGYLNPALMMPAQQHDGHFVTIEEARKKVRPINEVMVMEHNGTARAHPDFEMWRPHIAGDEKGLAGENIIMTYCSLTNLCIAYEPVIAGEPVDLKVAQQLENNLLMWDKNSGEPIQQLWGTRECDGRGGPRMREFPSFKMPFWAFEKAYPNGEVFIEKRPSFWRSPVRFLHDMVWDMAFYMHIMKQRNNAQFIFPTLKNEDSRLHGKEHVWGVSVGNDYLCYTKDFVISHDIINTKIGGRSIVIHWDDEYESLGMWYNDSGRDISEINFFGQSDQGSLRRVESMKAGAFYGVWYNFFPNTDINRL